jgi:predicted ATPase/class 3 adenylate cyclase
LVNEPATVTTFLFTDIEGSTRLWEQEPERMRPALARHDAIARSAVETHRGVVVKMTGDGMHAAFDDPLDAVEATLQLQRSLADAAPAQGVELRVRCGLHAGVFERRDNDFFGAAVNRAARIMSAAHGGQTLLSRAVADLLDGRLPAGVELRDLGAVRLRDLPHAEHVFQVEHPELPRDFPPLRSLAQTPNNLPHEVTSFIGREREVQAVREILARNREVTLVGMGGLGKTRLSLRVAAEAIDDYPDGVWFVELAPLRDPRLIAQAVASAVGVKEEAGRPVIEALERYVADRCLLLVLDNCEHLLLGCASVARHLLRCGARLKILASSREPLHLAGEATFLLSALAIPSLRVPFEPAVLAQFEAVQLFVERAIAAQPDFEITPENATAIAAICHRLDGIPLALELAAARVRMLSVEKIAERLTDRFKLLKGGDPSALPRQQTLRALIDWSYDLLSEPERSLFRQLAVFAGGWTLEAAEAVCACEEEDVLELLGCLVEKSLVVLDAQVGRYRLLETVRQYARERLHESGDPQKARARHLEYFVDFAEKAKPAIVGPNQATWLALVDRDLENLLVAHEWAGRAPEYAQSGLRMVSSVKQYWFNRGLLELGHRLITEALQRGDAQGQDAVRIKGLFDAGQFELRTGRYAKARAWLSESLAIARKLDDHKAIAALLQPLGLAALGEGDFRTARAILVEALDRARSRGDKRELAAALTAVAQLCRVEGRPDAAAPLHEEVLELARATGDHESTAIALLNLAMASVESGSFERARAMLLEVLAITEETRSKPSGVALLEVCAGLAALRGEAGMSGRFYGAAEAQGGETGLHRAPADEKFLLPLVEMARKAGDGAEFAREEARGRVLAHAEAMREARAWLVAR